MDKAAITNELQDLIRDAMVNQGSLLVLMRDERLLTMLIDVSKVAFRYNEDPAATEEHLSGLVETKLPQLRHPAEIRAWLKAYANSYCLNLKRDGRLADVHSGQRLAVEANGDHKSKQKTASNESAKEESHLPGKKKKKVERRRSLLFYELKLKSPRTREQELIDEAIEKEKETVQKERRQQLQAVVDQFSKDILKLWSELKSPEEISNETGVSVKTVYRVLNKFGRMACMEFGVDPDDHDCSLAVKRALYHRSKASEPGDPLTPRPPAE
jgi:DNA-directed RNA polymerase specialized sigma24 family protein